MHELRRLFDYNRWANLRYLEAAEDLSPEDGARDMGSSFPSVIRTLAHMLGAEWVWLERWNGSSPTSFPDLDALDSVAAVRARWDNLWRDQLAFLDACEAHDPRRSISYRNMSGTPDERPLDELMRHVINHATYHRGQLATLLRQLGRTPPPTDYVRYLRELE
jgi:uncharacterized damage-inducible protein DinB